MDLFSELFGMLDGFDNMFSVNTIQKKNRIVHSSLLYVEFQLKMPTIVKLMIENL